MKGVILAGGRGTRLKDLTKITNKHALPVWDKPMIHYPLQTLYEAGIRECLIVSNPKHVGQFHELLGNEFKEPVDLSHEPQLLPHNPGLGRNLREHYATEAKEPMQLSYAVQNNPVGGIADAISLAQGFAGGEPILVCLGDNIFLGEYDFSPFHTYAEAMIWISKVDDPTQYGVVTFDGEGEVGPNKVKKVVEKPKETISPWAQTGLYLYPNDVFEKIRELSLSERGELEVTDLNNLYAQEGRLYANIFDGKWIDAGTSAEELFRASELVRDSYKKSP